MSEEDAKAFLKKLGEDKELQEKLKGADSEEKFLVESGRDADKDPVHNRERGNAIGCRGRTQNGDREQWSDQQERDGPQHPFGRNPGQHDRLDTPGFILEQVPCQQYDDDDGSTGEDHEHWWNVEEPHDGIQLVVGEIRGNATRSAADQPDTIENDQWENRQQHRPGPTSRLGISASCCC